VESGKHGEQGSIVEGKLLVFHRVEILGQLVVEVFVEKMDVQGNTETVSDTAIFVEKDTGISVGKSMCSLNNCRNLTGFLFGSSFTY
jgi:hypothetical protein